MNVHIDLTAEIIPAKRCGLIEIGTHLNNCIFLHNAIYFSGFMNPGIDMIESTGWTCQYFFSEDKNTLNGTVCYYKNDLIRLCFNSKNILYFIGLKNGYKGKAFGKIDIGSTLGEVKENIEIEYDSGDEAYYPLEKSGVKGIAFYTGISPSVKPNEEDLFVLQNRDINSLDDDDKIIMISIQDWSLDDSLVS